MSDLIKREDAIRAYNEAMDELVKSEMEEFKLCHFTECYFDTTQCKLIAQKIEAVPSADRPKGEWREERNWRTASFYSVCSECGYFDDERDDLTAYNYCPQCGADMRGENNE